VNPVLTCNDHGARCAPPSKAPHQRQAMQVAAPMLRSGQLQRLSPWIWTATTWSRRSRRRHAGSHTRIPDHLRHAASEGRDGQTMNDFAAGGPQRPAANVDRYWGESKRARSDSGDLDARNLEHY
jgi:hypothetical protein